MQCSTPYSDLTLPGTTAASFVLVRCNGVCLATLPPNNWRVTREDIIPHTLYRYIYCLLWNHLYESSVSDGVLAVVYLLLSLFQSVNIVFTGFTMVVTIVLFIS